MRDDGELPSAGSLDAFIAHVLDNGDVPVLPAFLGADWDGRLRQLRILLAHVEETMCVSARSAAGDDVYIQLMRHIDGVELEAVSNEFLAADAVLDGAAVRTLLELGWRPPQGDERPNFWRFDELPVEPRVLAYRIAVTFYQVYGVRPGGDWSVSPPELLAWLD